MLVDSPSSNAVAEALKPRFFYRCAEANARVPVVADGSVLIVSHLA